MSNSPSFRIIPRSLSLLIRLAASALVAMAVLVALAIILLRYWLLPEVDQYHDRITASITEAIGSTVTIGKIEGDWEGLQPRLSLTDLRILDERGQPALILARVDSSVSWMSLFSAELRLGSLEIRQPELLVRRDAEGTLFLGDLSLSSDAGNHNLADWLLHQPSVVVRDALIVWVDEKRDAPPLVLQKVNLRIENLSNDHRFALRALPPENLATPLELRGDFRGASLAELGAWQGQLFTQLDYTDVTEWRHWLDLPREFSRGRGSLRAWMDIAAGSVAGVTADMELYNVVAKLADDAPDMVLARLSGRAAWKHAAGGFEIFTRKLAIRFQDGTELEPTDLYLMRTRTLDGQPGGGEMRANLLQLDKVASLASYFPMDPGERARLEAYSPRGRVSQLRVKWQGEPEKPESYSIKGHFEDVSLRQFGKMPGFSGLSMDVEGNNSGGRLNIKSSQLVIDAPGVMPEPLTFATLAGQVVWLRENNETRITMDKMTVANDDMAGSVFGSYLTKAGTLGELDLTASLTRGDIRHASRYVPMIALSRAGNDWLKGALLAGHTEDLSIRIKGNLSGFPLNGTKQGIFEIGGHAQDAVLDFAKGWPRIENIDGEFSIRGNRMEVKSPSATLSGARLQNVVVSLPAIANSDLVLEINGEADAENDIFLQFIQQSPVRGYISGVTDGMRASGNGHLDLFVGIPLKGDKPVKVSGSFRTQGSDVDLGKGIPLLRKTGGVLAFTEAGIQASGVAAEIAGGPTSIDVQTVGKGKIHVAAAGRCDLDVLRKSEGEAHPLLDYLRGGAEWDADINIVNRNAEVVINSDLRGIGSSLPKPFTKSARKAMRLRLQKLNIADGQDVVTAQLGGLLDARFERHTLDGVMLIKRGTINFGGQRKAADASRKEKRASETPRSKAGIWLTGTLPELSVQGWGGLIGGTTEPDSALSIAGASMLIGQLTGYGHVVTGLKLDAVKRGDGLAARLASNTLNGELEWLPRGYRKGGKFTANLRNLHLVEDERTAQAPSPSGNAETPELPEKIARAGVPRPGKLPALDIRIDDLQIKDMQFGRLELVGHPDGKDWRLSRLNIANPDGTLAGDGLWRSVQPVTQTQLTLQLKFDDAGKTLARYGYPGMVKDGSGILEATLSWEGAPYEFSYGGLNGTLKLDAGKGRFLKMDQGAGKFLSILSMQALPAHITLDFNDVFRKGFQFDDINSNATIKGGVINMQAFEMAGSSAKVTMSGTVDLNSETQDLRVKILPTLGDSVSLISAFTVGPAVGVGTLIVSKILGHPLDKLVSFEYNVTGTWSAPVVAKVVQPQIPFE